MTARRRLSEIRSTLHDIASELDGLAMREGLASVDVAAAAERVRNGMGRVTDALTHRLNGEEGR